MFGKLFQKLSGNNEEKGMPLYAPMKGTVIPLSQVSDPTFAEGILGQGVAVEPAEGKVYAPADGEVLMMFETGHAGNIQTTSGAELLVHVGIDTVNLKGKHFTAHCKSGDQVKQGDLLIEFDKDAIKAEGYQVVTPVIVCNPDDYAKVEPTKDTETDPSKVVLTLHKK